MYGNLSRSAGPTSYPRLLIAENNFSTVKSLVRTFRDERLLDVAFDVCTSPRGAVRRLLADPYQLLISGVHLAEMDDFLLLTRTQALETFVPLVITASALEKESARQVLQQGAFDLITTPLDHEQTVSTISLALWHNKLTTLIASRDKALERYQRHITKFPGNRRGEAFRTIQKSIEESIAAHERTIDRIETNVNCFADLAKNVESQARERALERLDVPSK